MLNLIAELSASLLSEPPTWDPASLHALPAQNGPSVVLPNEPSTLALAIIGIGIVTAYAGVQRWRRPQQPLVKLTVDFGGYSKKQSKKQKQRKRGAA